MTFPTGVEIRKCSDEKLKTILDEAGEASKHARQLGRVMGIVAARRLKHMREFIANEELAFWIRDNGFDRVVEDEESSFMFIACFRPLRSNTMPACDLR